jgi:small subunit ribosomal protein S2
MINNEQQKNNASSIDIQSLAIESGIDESILTEMAKAGVFYGHKKSRKNPKFDEYIYGLRNGIAIIDLVKTLKAIGIVAGFIKSSLAEKKSFIVVGTQPALKDAVLKLSGALNNCPYVINRWIGGLITNFGVIGKRISYFKKRKEDFNQGKFEAYTKKEKLLISREIEKMEALFTGLNDMTKVPDIMFVIDPSLKGHATAVHEALLSKIKIIGIIDNDDDPSKMDYFIPANDHSKSSVDLIVNYLIEKIKS